jgi:CRISPR-associated endonuclease/helicase Cas3
MDCRFADYFSALHAVAPWPWQERLAAAETWPAAVDLPTGAGKTSMVDIHLWRLAAGYPDTPRRLVWVIDWRVVVDATFARAESIAVRLREGRAPALREVAGRLRALGGSDDALVAVRLRGGVMTEEPLWSPAQPAVVVSTVDQAGSRLLFRGYGVSPGMRPVHAGLLGSDACWVVDEAHLSRLSRPH